MMTRQEENKRNSRILKAIKNMCEKHIADGTIGSIFKFDETYQQFIKGAQLHNDKDDIKITVGFREVNKNLIMYEIWLSNGLKLPDYESKDLRGCQCEEIYKLLFDNIHLFKGSYDRWDDKDFYSKFLSKYE